MERKGGGAEIKRESMKRETLSTQCWALKGTSSNLVSSTVPSSKPPLLLLTVCSISQGLGTGDGNTAGVACYWYVCGSPPSFYLALLAVKGREGGWGATAVTLGPLERWAWQSLQRKEETMKNNRHKNASRMRKIQMFKWHLGYRCCHSLVRKLLVWRW